MERLQGSTIHLRLHVGLDKIVSNVVDLGSKNRTSESIDNAERVRARPKMPDLTCQETSLTNFAFLAASICHLQNTLSLPQSLADLISIHCRPILPFRQPQPAYGGLPTTKEAYALKHVVCFAIARQSPFYEVREVANMRNIPRRCLQGISANWSTRHSH